MPIGIKENKNSSDYDTVSLTDSIDGSTKPKQRRLKKMFTSKSKKYKRNKEHVKNDNHFDYSLENENSVALLTEGMKTSSTDLVFNKEKSFQRNISPLKEHDVTKDKMSMEQMEETHKLHVTLLRGEDLASRDSNGLSDPYVKFKLKGRTIYRSKCWKMTLNPTWNESFDFPVSLDSTLQLRVFDRDRGLRDDFMGSASIPLSEVGETSTTMRIKLEEYNSNEDLGFIHLSIHVQPHQNQHIEIPISVQHVQSDRSSLRKRESITPNTLNRKEGSKEHQIKATATIQLVSGTGLPARDANGLSDPYVKLNLGKIKRKSKVCYKTLSPMWKEEFTFSLTSQESSILEISVWDKDSYRKDDFMGRCTLDLWSLSRDETHSLSLDLTDISGSLLLLATVLEFDPHQQQRNLKHYDITSLKKQYAFKETFNDIKDIGLTEIEVISASDLKSADLNGKSDPFCVVQLCNSRVQTHTCYKTLNPVWNRVFTFPIHDIHDIFEISIYDEDTEDREFLGCCLIPILSVNNGMEHTYFIKDRKLGNPTKGSVTVKINYIFNPARAAIRTFTPREEKHMQEELKFKKSLLTRNFHRVWSIVQSLLATTEFINSCFTWNNPRRSFIAFITFLLIVWNFQLYMLPISLLVIFLKNYIEIFVQKTRPVQSLGTDDHTKLSAEEEEDGDESTNHKLSLMKRLNAIQDILIKVQSILDTIASFGERVYNTFTWSFPFLSWLAIIVLSLICLLLYFIPLRIIVLLWGINKFTKRLRKPNYVPNNELMDYLSRVPSNVELNHYREIHVEPHSRTLKKKK